MDHTGRNQNGGLRVFGIEHCACLFLTLNPYNGTHPLKAVHLGNHTESNTIGQTGVRRNRDGNRKRSDSRFLSGIVRKLIRSSKKDRADCGKQNHSEKHAAKIPERATDLKPEILKLN